MVNPSNNSAVSSVLSDLNGIGAGPERYRTAPMPELVDPLNPRPDLSPSDFIMDGEPMTSEAEKKVVQMVLSDLKADKQAKAEHYPEMFNSWAAMKNDHWTRWDNDLGKYIPTRAPAPQSATTFQPRYRTYNKLTPIGEKAIEEALQSKEAPNIAPLTTSETDQLAVQEGRAVLSHVEYSTDWEDQLYEAAAWSYWVGVPLLHTYFDPLKKALVPLLGPNGETIRTMDIEVGDICRDIYNPTEWFADAKAKRFKNISRLTTEMVHPLEYVQKRFGKRGYRVKADATMDDQGTYARVVDITRDSLSAADAAKSGVRLVTRWEPPSVRYEKGRLIHVANDMVLDYAEELPDTDDLPFDPLYFAKNLQSVQGRNGVAGALDGQVLINKQMGRLEEHVDESTYYIMAPENSEPDIDIARSDRLKTMYFYKPGAGEITMHQTPSLQQEHLTVLELAEDSIRDYMSVHLASDSQTPTGVTSGIALQRLQQGDNIARAGFIRNINAFACNVGEHTLQCARRNYNIPRLMFYQDTAAANKGEAATRAMTFHNLSEGRYILTPGTSRVKDPILNAQMVMDMAEKGMLAPEVVPFTIVLLEMMGMENPTKVGDDMLAALKHVEEAKAREAQASAQAEQAHQLEVMKLQLQQQSQLKQMELQFQLQAKTLEIQMQAQAEQSKGGIAAQVEQMKAQVKAQSEALTAQIKTDAAGQLEQIKAMMQIAVEMAIRNLPPAIAPISVTADPTAVVAIEGAAGYEGKVPPPPKPAGNSNSGKKP